MKKYKFELSAQKTKEAINFDGVIKELEEQCNKNNLQFQEDWVHIDTQNGYAVVQNEYGRILASIHF